MAGLFDQLLTCTASVKKLWPKKSRREETRACDMAESRSLLFPLGRERRHSPFPRVYALFSTIFFRLPRCSNAGHVFTALTFPRFSWKPSERRAPRLSQLGQISCSLYDAWIFPINSYKYVIHRAAINILAAVVACTSQVYWKK